MKKKVLIISSSPRAEGNSEILCNHFKKGAEEAGHQVEQIALRDKHIQYCNGCGVCAEQQPCPLQDDAAEIVQKMIDANIIVLATPVYFCMMSAQMKTLIDRCCARYTEIKDKDFYYILTAAEDDEEDIQSAIDGFRAFLTCLDTPTEQPYICGLGVHKKGEIENTDVCKEAYLRGLYT